MNRFVKSFMASAVLLGSISQVSAQEMVEIVV